MVHEIREKNLFEIIRDTARELGYKNIAIYTFSFIFLITIGITFYLSQTRQTITQQAAPKEDLPSNENSGRGKKNPTPTTTTYSPTPDPTPTITLPTITPTPSPVTPSTTDIPSPTINETIVPSPTKTQAQKADFNNNGTVDIQDLSYLLSKWGTNDAIADLNADGIINTTDLSILLSNYNK